jgi:hypothetical protein
MKAINLTLKIKLNNLKKAYKIKELEIFYENCQWFISLMN